MKFSFAGKTGPMAFILCLIVMAVYANSLETPFLWDDERLILENPWIRSTKNIPYFFSTDYWDLHHPIREGLQYRPTRVSSFAIDYALWGANPAGFHFTNLLLHMLNTLLLFFFILKLFNLDSDEKTPGFLTAPFLAALLFALHPVHSESIDFIKNRSELMSFFFGVSSLFVYLKFIQNGKGAGILGAWAGALLCFFLALTSKETAAAIPFILVLYLLCFPSKESVGKRLISSLPYFITGAAFFAFRFMAFSNGSSGEASPGLFEHAVIILKTTASYLWMLVYPFNLTIEHSMPNFFDAGLLMGCAILMLMLGGAVKAWEKAPLAFFSLGWIIVALGPASNIHYLATRPIAEQRLYLPSAGFCLLAGLAISKFFSDDSSPGRRFRKTGALGFTALLLSAYAWTAVNQNRLWGDPVRLWTKAVETSGGTYRALFNQGNALAEAGRAEEAIKAYNRVLEISPESGEVHNNLANALVDAGEISLAMEHFKKAMIADPGDGQYPYNLANALADLKRLDEAVLYYDMAVRLKPGFAMAHNNLGNVQSMRGNNELAIHHFQQAIDFKPDHYKAHHNLANALVKKGELKKAEKHFLIALDHSEDSPIIHYDYGNLLSMTGRLEQAAAQHMKALAKISDEPKIHANLANCLARLGRFTEAIQHYEAALALKPDDAQILTNMGIAMADQGRVDEAVSRFRAAVKNDEKFAPAYYNLGYVLAKQGNHKEAEPLLLKAVEITPDYGKALYELGNAYANMGDAGKASEFFLKAIKAEPSNAKAYNNMGVILARENKMKEALTYFEKAVELQPGYYEAEKHLKQARKLAAAQ